MYFFFFLPHLVGKSRGTNIITPPTRTEATLRSHFFPPAKCQVKVLWPGVDFCRHTTCTLRPHTNIMRTVLDELLWQVAGTKTSCCVAEDERKPTKVTEPNESAAPCELFTKTHGNPGVFLSNLSSASSTYHVFLLFTTQFSASCLASWNRICLRQLKKINKILTFGLFNCSESDFADLSLHS